MEVRIWLDHTDPPVGRLRSVLDNRGSGAGEPSTEEFSGWLGLLRALSDVLGSATERSGAQDRRLDELEIHQLLHDPHR